MLPSELGVSKSDICCILANTQITQWPSSQHICCPIMNRSLPDTTCSLTGSSWTAVADGDCGASKFHAGGWPLVSWLPLVEHSQSDAHRRDEVRKVGRPNSGLKNKEITGVRLCKELGAEHGKGNYLQRCTWTHQMVYISHRSWSCTMFGSCICHWYQVIHKQCMTFWEETNFFSCCLAPDPVCQQRWSSLWCARGCAPWLRAIVCPYLPEQQDVWWLYSPLEKHTEACNFIIHGKI